MTIQLIKNAISTQTLNNINKKIKNKNNSNNKLKFNKLKKLIRKKNQKPIIT